MDLRGNKRRRGFTLIELLVVVAIIALLISILLPSLSRAREQAKITKCLSNLKNLTLSTQTYFTEFNDEFPFAVIVGNSWMGICPWTYGGQTADPWWQTRWDGIFYLRAKDRPLNSYLMSGPIEPDLEENGQVIKRSPVPALQCPSDRQSRARGSIWDEPLNVPSWEDTGTSYWYNLEAFADLKEGVNEYNPWQQGGQGWIRVGRRLIKDMFAKYSSEFTLFLDEPADIGLLQRMETMGTHNSFGKHSVGFLDGHAEHRSLNTRKWCGPGWKAINPNWIRRAGQPIPPIHYKYTWKNCD